MYSSVQDRRGWQYAGGGVEKSLTVNKRGAAISGGPAKSSKVNVYRVGSYTWVLQTEVERRPTYALDQKL